MVPHSCCPQSQRFFCWFYSLQGVWSPLMKEPPAFWRLGGPEFTGTSGDLLMMGTSTPSDPANLLCPHQLRGLLQPISHTLPPYPHLLLFSPPALTSPGLCRPSWSVRAKPARALDKHCLSSGLQLDDISQEEVDKKLTGNSILTLSPEGPAETLTEGSGLMLAGTYLWDVLQGYTAHIPPIPKWQGQIIIEPALSLGPSSTPGPCH